MVYRLCVLARNRLEFFVVLQGLWIGTPGILRCAKLVICGKVKCANFLVINFHRFVMEEPSNVLSSNTPKHFLFSVRIADDSAEHDVIFFKEVNVFIKFLFYCLIDGICRMQNIFWVALLSIRSEEILVAPAPLSRNGYQRLLKKNRTLNSTYGCTQLWIKSIHLLVFNRKTRCY